MSRGFFPRELLPWREGRTEVDVTISWENPATTVFLEMKYLSSLSKSTSGDDGSSGIPSDQFIRNIRVGLLETGWYHRDELFESSPRDFCILLVSMNKQDSLADRYRDSDHVCASISSQNRLKGLPEAPFVGQIDYQSSRVYYQLWRNTVFAEWMAKLDHPQTQAFHVNLVRDGADVESAFEFRRMINEPYQNRFQRLTWEKLYSLCSHETELSRLKRYFESKTAGLQRAFAI